MLLVKHHVPRNAVGSCHFALPHFPPAKKRNARETETEDLGKMA